MTEAKDRVRSTNLRALVRLLTQVALRNMNRDTRRHWLLSGVASILQGDLWALGVGANDASLKLVDCGGPDPKLGSIHFQGFHHDIARHFSLADFRLIGGAESLPRRARDGKRSKRQMLVLRIVNDGGEHVKLIIRRPAKRPCFDQMDRRFARLVLEEISWLRESSWKDAESSNMPLLTPRQTQVLKRLLAGDSEKQVALALGLSRLTVRVHVREICRRTKMSNRAALVAAFLNRFVDER